MISKSIFDCLRWKLWLLFKQSDFDYLNWKLCLSFKKKSGFDCFNRQLGLLFKWSDFNSLNRNLCLLFKKFIQIKSFDLDCLIWKFWIYLEVLCQLKLKIEKFNVSQIGWKRVSQVRDKIFREVCEVLICTKFSGICLFLFPSY